ncbi:hypothetical protein ACFFGH_33650 [Lysobacter korlensis]|uniref:Uncharacterized protein n=1 Tax=Lysobacter korlensis TaxID=553636 RepID=A0ABV6S0P1_9GAMM
MVMLAYKQHHVTFPAQPQLASVTELDPAWQKTVNVVRAEALIQLLEGSGPIPPLDHPVPTTLSG